MLYLATTAKSSLSPCAGQIPGLNTVGKGEWTTPQPCGNTSAVCNSGAEE